MFVYLFTFFCLWFFLGGLGVGWWWVGGGVGVIWFAPPLSAVLV